MSGGGEWMKMQRQRKWWWLLNVEVEAADHCMCPRSPESEGEIVAEEARGQETVMTLPQV